MGKCFTQSSPRAFLHPDSRFLVREVCKSANFHFTLMGFISSLLLKYWGSSFLTSLTFSNRSHRPKFVPKSLLKFYTALLPALTQWAPWLVSLWPVISFHQQSVVVLPVDNSLPILWSFHSPSSDVTNNFPCCTTSNTLLDGYHWDFFCWKHLLSKRRKMPVSSDTMYLS